MAGANKSAEVLLVLLDVIRAGCASDDPHAALSNIESYTENFIEAGHSRRVIACANACEGIATEDLEGKCFELRDWARDLYQLEGDV